MPIHSFTFDPYRGQMVARRRDLTHADLTATQRPLGETELQARRGDFYAQSLHLC